jgi:hypothetical protein
VRCDNRKTVFKNPPFGRRLLRALPMSGVAADGQGFGLGDKSVSAALPVGGSMIVR